MNVYSPRSERKLLTCQEPLIRVFRRVLPIRDHTVLWGARTVDQQWDMIESHASHLDDPLDSKHVVDPGLRSASAAIDVAPYFPNPPHIRWRDHGAFRVLAGVVFAMAALEGVELRWGGDWDRDWSTVDQGFNDLGHFELVYEEDR